MVISAKNILRFVLSLFLVYGINPSLEAQPYLSNFNVWTNSRTWITGAPPPYYSYTHFSVGGDSLINSTVYKKILRSERYCGHLIWVPAQNSPCSAIPSTPVLAALIREVGQRWYLLGSAGQDSLLYRFDLAKGDSVYGAQPPSFYVVDSVIHNFNQSGRKLFQVRDTSGISSPLLGQGILEGIGPTTGFLSRLLFFPFEDEEQLMCYSALPDPVYCPWFIYLNVEEKELFREYLNLFPNPAAQVLNIRLLNLAGPYKLSIRDAFGCVLFENEYDNSDFLIHLHELPDGFYLIEIETPDHMVRRRFIKQE